MANETNRRGVLVTWAQLEAMRNETSLQRDMRLAMTQPAGGAAVTPAGWSKRLGVEIRRPDGRPFAANGKTTLTTAELKAVKP